MGINSVARLLGVEAEKNIHEAKLEVGVTYRKSNFLTYLFISPIYLFYLCDDLFKAHDI